MSVIPITMSFKIENLEKTGVIYLFFFFGFLFYRNNQQDLFNALGVMYSALFFFGINSCSSILPFISIQRTVMYREMFAGMYSSWAYSFAQV